MGVLHFLSNSGPYYTSNYSPAIMFAKKDNFSLSSYYQHHPGSSHRYSRLHDRISEKKQKKMFALFCKSICFILLLLSFIMVLVTVSIFLSKGINRKEEG